MQEETNKKSIYIRLLQIDKNEIASRELSSTTTCITPREKNTSIHKHNDSQNWI